MGWTQARAGGKVGQRRLDSMPWVTGSQGGSAVQAWPGGALSAAVLRLG